MYQKYNFEKLEIYRLTLLMLTRKVDKDDAQAGFTYSWVKKLAQKTDRLKVICLEKGNLDNLPANVEVFSLGKERYLHYPRFFRRLILFWNFQKGSLKFIRKVDGVFCHMNPEYTILIAPYAKLFRKKIVTWYSHKAVNWKVRLINILADKIITPTKEGFGLESKKKLILGHGIDTDLFKPAANKKKDKVFQIISVGRISPIKDYPTLIQTIEMIVKKQPSICLKVNIIGSPGLPHQQTYYDQLKKMVQEKNLETVVNFKGAIPNQQLPSYYQQADLSINLCPTGSPDKAVLESMACGLPVLVCNKTFVTDLGPYVEKLLFKEKDPADLAEKILNLMKDSQLTEIGLFLREQVVKHHNLDNLVEKIIDVFRAF